MPYLLLITSYLLLFFFLCFKKIKWAVLLVIFTLPAYLIRFQLGPLPMTLLEAEILILFLVWLIKTLGHKNTRLPAPERSDGGQVKVIKQDLKNKNFVFLYSCILVFLCAATISIFISPNLRAAAGLWKAYFIEPILFLIVFVSTLKKKDLKNVLLFFSASVLVLSLFAIYQKLTGAFIPNEFWAAQATRRVTSFFTYPNALALYLAPIVVILLGYLIYQMKNFIGNWKLRKATLLPRDVKDLYVPRNFTLVIENFLYLVSCILGILAIYFTRSKGALFAILAGIIFYAIFYKGYRKISISILAVVFILVFLYFYIFISLSETPRGANELFNLQGTATVEGGDSISTRIEMWQETWQMLKTRPILGAGLAGYQPAVAPFHQKEYIEIYLYPHNVILNFWSETGLLGLLAFIAIIIWFYKTGFAFVETRRGASLPNTNRFNIILMASMTTLLVHGLVDVPYFKNDLAVLFWVIIGSLVILNSFQDPVNPKITSG